MKTIKKKLRFLLELQFLPRLSVFLFKKEIWTRLLPLKRLLKIVDPHSLRKIIDIGAGTGRLEAMLGRFDIFIYDTSEEYIEIAGERFKNTRVSRNGKFDFADNSFDWAISVHTLEHIPRNKREEFILEMIRIAEEGVLINFPEGRYAEKICKNYLDKQKENNLDFNKWTIEHLAAGLPDYTDIQAILDKQDKFIFKYKKIRNYYIENWFWTKIRASNSKILEYLFSPFLAVLSYLFRESKPTAEIIIVGTKNGNLSERIVKRL